MELNFITFNENYSERPLLNFESNDLVVGLQLPSIQNDL